MHLWEGMQAQIRELLTIMHYLTDPIITLSPPLQVTVYSCDGKCPSATIFNFNINSHARFCKCCRESGLQTRSVTLYCSRNATVVEYNFQEPLDCSCQWNWMEGPGERGEEGWTDEVRDFDWWVNVCEGLSDTNETCVKTQPCLLLFILIIHFATLTLSHSCYRKISEITKWEIVSFN